MGNLAATLWGQLRREQPHSYRPLHDSKLSRGGDFMTFRPCQRWELTPTIEEVVMPVTAFHM